MTKIIRRNEYVGEGYQTIYSFPFSQPTEMAHGWLEQFYQCFDKQEEYAIYTKGRKAEIFYYILMSLRKMHSKLFPVSDICLFAVNLLARQKQGKSMHILLQDWAMLPVALLATCFGARVSVFPLSGEEQKYMEKTCVFLQKELPQGGWNRVGSTLPEQYYLLGQNPLVIAEKEFSATHTKAIVGGVVLCSWDFLGLSLYGYARRLWVEQGLIHSILQLPRPRRQGVNTYPALLNLGQGNTKSIGMAQISSMSTGLNATAMKTALQALEQGIQVRVQNLLRSGLCNLTPAIHEEEQNPTPTEGNVLLRQVAHVLRCQLPRTTFDHQAWQSRAEATLEVIYDNEDNAVGVEPTIFATFHRELGLADVDAVSGFVNIFGGQSIVLRITSYAKQGKFLLQPGDIVLIFRGSLESIGKVGYVDDMPEDSDRPYRYCNYSGGLSMGGHIAGKSMLLIRPFAVDGAWLFSYLRQNHVRKSLASHASGASLLTITMENVKNMTIPLPSAAEVNKANIVHQEVAECVAEIKRQYAKIVEAREWSFDEESSTSHDLGSAIEDEHTRKTICP